MPDVHARDGAARQLLRDLCSDRDWLHEEIRRAAAAIDPLLPPSTTSPTTIGKAIELRIALDFVDRSAPPAILRSVDRANAERILALAQAAVADAQPSAAEDELLRDCCWLALWQEVHHASDRRGAPSTAASNVIEMVQEVGRAGADELAHLRALWTRYCEGPRHELRSLGRAAEIAPWLLRRWAQADLVVGRTLVEIKAAAPSSTAINGWVDQIHRYLLVAERDRFAFNSAALYLAREGVLLRWPVHEVIERCMTRSVRLSALQEQFRERVTNPVAVSR